jgi:hypothetical protein
VPWGQLENGGDQRGCGATDEGNDSDFENRLHPKLLAKRNLIFSITKLYCELTAINQRWFAGTAPD